MKMRVSYIDPLNPSALTWIKNNLEVNGTQYGVMYSQFKETPLQTSIDITTVMAMDLDGGEMPFLLSDTDVDPAVSMALCSSAFIFAPEVHHFARGAGTILVTAYGGVFVETPDQKYGLLSDEFIRKFCHGFVFDTTHHAKMLFSRHMARLLKASLPSHHNDAPALAEPQFIF